MPGPMDCLESSAANLEDWLSEALNPMQRNGDLRALKSPCLDVASTPARHLETSPSTSISCMSWSTIGLFDSMRPTRSGLDLPCSIFLHMFKNHVKLAIMANSGVAVKTGQRQTGCPTPTAGSPPTGGLGATQPCHHLVSNTGAEHAAYWSGMVPLSWQAKSLGTSAEKSKSFRCQRPRINNGGRSVAIWRGFARTGADGGRAPMWLTILRLPGTRDLVEPKEVPVCDTAQASCTWLYRARY